MDSLRSNNRPIDTHQGIISLIESESVKVVRISEFLPKQDRNSLYENVCNNQEAFGKLKSPGPDIGTTLYLKLEPNEIESVNANFIQKIYELLCKRIIEELPSLFETLSIEPFVVSKIRMTLMNCSNGHNGSPHTDSINGQYKISILYYFHRFPKMFSGGNLELYNNDNNSLNGYSNEPCFTIDFEDNSLIAFASETFHGVTKVQSDSDNFEDGRFVAVGFLSSQQIEIS